MKVAIIITTKNENDKAATCLEECQRQIDSLASDEKYSFSIFMNTQGSMGIESTWSHASKEQFEFYIFIDSGNLVVITLGKVINTMDFLKKFFQFFDTEIYIFLDFLVVFVSFTFDIGSIVFCICKNVFESRN